MTKKQVRFIINSMYTSFDQINKVYDEVLGTVRTLAETRAAESDDPAILSLLRRQATVQYYASSSWEQPTDEGMHYPELEANSPVCDKALPYGTTGAVLSWVPSNFIRDRLDNNEPIGVWLRGGNVKLTEPQVFTMRTVYAPQSDDNPQSEVLRFIPRPLKPEYDNLQGVVGLYASKNNTLSPEAFMTYLGISPDTAKSGDHTLFDILTRTLLKRMSQEHAELVVPRLGKIVVGHIWRTGNSYGPQSRVVRNLKYEPENKHGVECYSYNVCLPDPQDPIVEERFLRAHRNDEGIANVIQPDDQTDTSTPLRQEWIDELTQASKQILREIREIFELGNT